MMRIVKGLVTGGSGDNWLASTQGLPDGKQAMAVAKNWRQLQDMLQDAAERTLGLPSGSVMVDMEFEDPELQKLIDEVRRTRGALRDAQFEAGAAMGLAARTLTKTATVRDVAQMLGCSHQQVARLAPKPLKDEPGNTPKDWAEMLYEVAGVRRQATARELAEEAKSWIKDFPDDPRFAQDVTREHALLLKASAS